MVVMNDCGGSRPGSTDDYLHAKVYDSGVGDEVG